ncbi:MAG: hypothetical protein ACR5K4_01390 [Sodalis sp. (in: enterobacteria)]
MVSRTNEEPGQLNAGVINRIPVGRVVKQLLRLDCADALITKIDFVACHLLPKEEGKRQRDAQGTEVSH